VLFLGKRYADMSEGEQISEDVTYAPLTEVAAAYGVSVDTIRRRLKRGELDARKETTPQGFRWVAALPAHAQTVGERAVVAEHEAGAAQGELVATLQRELELRNQEIARLHEVVERQAVALERAVEALPQLPATTSSTQPQSAQDGPAVPVETFWQRLRRLIRS
jgi:hypothetical protein